LTQGFTFWGGHGRANYETADVVVGDRLVPSEIFVNVRGGISTPDFAMKIEVRQGIPVCTEVSLTARPDGPEIREKDLKYLRLNDWLEQIVAQCSMKYSSSGGVTGWAKPVDDWGALADMQKVAEIYRQHFDKRPTEAVARSFGVSHRTAARYVQQARAAGHLPDTDRGRKKA
jgi:hypothetical protein